MDYQNLHLKNLIDLEKWQRVQDALAEATEMAIITVDFRGFPVTRHSGCTDFCTAIRNNPLTRKDCYKCDSRGGLEAARGNRPYIYLCHCNIVDVAVPIVVNEKYVGAVMIGQVLLEEEDDDEAALEQILMCMDAEGRVQREQLYDAYERLPRMSYGRIVTITNMIFELINYILLEATSKNNLINTYEWMLQSGGSSAGGPAAGRPTEDLTLESMVKLKDKVSYAILKSRWPGRGRHPYPSITASGLLWSIFIHTKMKMSPWNRWPSYVISAPATSAACLPRKWGRRSAIIWPDKKWSGPSSCWRPRTVPFPGLRRSWVSMTTGTSSRYLKNMRVPRRPTIENFWTEANVQNR
jgi:ligand-binding sensor protein